MELHKTRSKKEKFCELSWKPFEELYSYGSIFGDLNSSTYSRINGKQFLSKQTVNKIRLSTKNDNKFNVQKMATRSKAAVPWEQRLQFFLRRFYFEKIFWLHLYNWRRDKQNPVDKTKKAYDINLY